MNSLLTLLPPHPPLCAPGATIQVAEIAIYLALSANWAALAAPAGWQPLAVLAAAMVVPLLYTRQIVDFAC